MNKIAKVISNNQPGWTNIIETDPHVTLDIGTCLYLKEDEKPANGIEKLVSDMKNYTDCNPWYWVSYGEKCYGFGVVEAYPYEESEAYPAPGTQLIYNDDGNWEGDNGVEMTVNSWIATFESQNGDIVSHFIAAAHAHHMGDVLTAK